MMTSKPTTAAPVVVSRTTTNPYTMATTTSNSNSHNINNNHNRGHTRQKEGMHEGDFKDINVIIN
jgi:hypothetical protein